MATATKSCICNRCGRGIAVGSAISFESYVTRGHRKTGSGRHTGGGETAYRPIHAYDCAAVEARRAERKDAAWDLRDRRKHGDERPRVLRALERYKARFPKLHPELST